MGQVLGALGPASHVNPMRGNVLSDAADNWVSMGTGNMPSPIAQSPTTDYASSILRPYGDVDTAASMTGVSRRTSPRKPIPPTPRGAPADFGGVVIPNPNGIRPLEDTDPPPATRLPNGIKFNHQNFSGAMGGDISNPPKAQLIPRGKRSY